MMMKKAAAVFALLLLLSPAAAAQETSGQESASAGVTPDSILWGIDVALDNIRLALARTDNAKAEVGLQIAEERLQEVKAATEAGNLEAAQKSQRKHAELMTQVKSNIQSVKADSDTQELQKVMRLEKSFREHEAQAERVSQGLRGNGEQGVKRSSQEKKILTAFSNSIENSTDETKTVVKKKKGNIRQRMRERGLTDAQINEIFAEQENRSGLADFFQERADERISEAEQAIADAKAAADELERRIEEGNVSLPPEMEEEFEEERREMEEEFEEDEGTEEEFEDNETEEDEMENNETTGQWETRTEVDGSVELSEEGRATLEELASTLDEVEREIEFLLEVEKEDNDTEVTRDEVEGETTQEQDDLWADIREEAVTSVNRSNLTEAELRVRARRTFNENETEEEQERREEFEQQAEEREEELERRAEEREEEFRQRSRERARELHERSKEEAALFFAENRLRTGRELIDRAEFHLGEAETAFEESKYGKAYGRATASWKIALNAQRILTGNKTEEDINETLAHVEDIEKEHEEEIEIEIESETENGQTVTEVKVEVKRNDFQEEVEFTLNTADRETIIEEIARRTSLTREEVERFIGPGFEGSGKFGGEFEAEDRERFRQRDEERREEFRQRIEEEFNETDFNETGEDFEEFEDNETEEDGSGQWETRLRVNGSIQLSGEGDDMVRDLAFTLNETEREVEFRLEVEKEDNSTEVTRDEVEGETTQEQDDLWADIREEAVSSSENSDLSDGALQIRVRRVLEEE